MADLSMQSAADFRAVAQERLSTNVWNYLVDGEGTGNEQAFADVRLVPRPLRDLRDGHTRLALLGEALEHPMLLAPVAYQRLFHPDGEAASAMAASAQGGQSVISSLASQPFPTIVEAALQGAYRDRGSAPWFQLYWQGSREATLRLLQRAQAAGCTTLVLTVDAPIKRASLQLPPGIAAVNLESGQGAEVTPERVFSGLMAQAPAWADLVWLRQQWHGPLLVKGVMHPDDAEQAIAAGCDAIVVSNHGGRVLTGSALSLQALPAIVQRVRAHVGGGVPIVFDSGVRSGRDIFVALACGASAVLIGRPYLWGLAANGAIGVAQVIRLLRDELEMTMALTGCASLDEIGPHCLA